MPRRLLPKVGNFTRHPNLTHLRLQHALNLPRQFSDGQHMPCLLRRKKFSKVPLGLF